MIVLGLTGSIGMGKSATAQMFRERGIEVHDSDATVHQLYAGEAVLPIEEAFPGTTRDGRVDRALLSARVLGKSEDLKKLETIVHMVVLDIPLLFETRDPSEFDVILVVSASESVQRKRVLARPGMTSEKFEKIREKQIPDAEKRRRAHFVVNSDLGFAAAEAQVDAVLRSLACRQ